MAKVSKTHLKSKGAGNTGVKPKKGSSAKAAKDDRKDKAKGSKEKRLEAKKVDKAALKSAEKAKQAAEKIEKAKKTKKEVEKPKDQKRDVQEKTKPTKTEKPKQEVKKPVEKSERSKEAVPPLKRVSGKRNPQVSVVHYDPASAPATMQSLRTPSPKRAFNSPASDVSMETLECWKKEAKARGQSLETYMEEMSRSQLEASSRTTYERVDQEKR